MKSIIQFTPELKILLEKVNTEINDLPYRQDQDRYGRENYWAEIDTQGGDCEDYALRKRSELINQGLSAKALNVATCSIPDSSGRKWGHAVLIVQTSKGDFVLDNYFRDTVRNILDVSEFTWRRITRSSDFPPINGVIKLSRRMWLHWFWIQRVKRFLNRI